MPKCADLSHLSTHDLEAVAKALDRGLLAAHLTAGRLAAAGLAIDHKAVAAALADLPPEALAPVLQAALAERRAHRPRAELVWTGPEPAFSPTRSFGVRPSHGPYSTP